MPEGGDFMKTEDAKKKQPKSKEILEAQNNPMNPDADKILPYGG